MSISVPAGGTVTGRTATWTPSGGSAAAATLGGTLIAPTYTATVPGTLALTVAWTDAGGQARTTVISQAISAVPAGVAPGAFAAGMISLAAGTGQYTASIVGLPAAGDAPITAVMRRTSTDAGATWSAWVTHDSAAPFEEALTVSAAAGALQVQFRADSSVGPGAVTAGLSWGVTVAAAPAPATVVEPVGGFYPSVAAVDLSLAGGSIQFPENNSYGMFSADPTSPFRGLITGQRNFGIGGNAVRSALFGTARLPLDKRGGNTRWGLIGSGVSGANNWAVYFGSTGYATTGERNCLVYWMLGNGANTQLKIISPPVTEDAFAWSVTCDGAANWEIAWYSLRTGTKYATAFANGATTSSTTATTAPFNIGSASQVTEFVDNAANARWSGEVGEIGYARDLAALPDAAAFTAWALGGPASDLVPGDKVRLYRALDGSTAGYAAQSWATGDTAPALAPVGSTTPGVNGSTLYPGSTLRRQTTGQYLTLDLLSHGRMFALLPGATAAPARFSGTGGGFGGQIEVRVIRRTDGAVVANWTPIATLSGGTWEGRIRLPKSAGAGWYFVEARAASMPSLIAHGRNMFAIGWKVLAQGQSQGRNAYANSSRGWVPTEYLRGSVVRGGNDTVFPPTLDRIGVVSLSDGEAGIYNAIRKFDPTTPIQIIFDAVGGTSMLQVIDDISSTRTFAMIERALAVAGKDISVITQNWLTAELDAGAAARYRLEAMLFGTGPNAGAHNINALLDPGWTFALSPGTRHGTTSAIDARGSLVDFANERSFAVGPPVNDYYLTDAYHADFSNIMGSVLSPRMGLAAAKALGLTTIRNSYFTTATLGSGGTKITVGTTLLNGGALSSPAPTALVGFTVDGSAAGFTAAIEGGAVVLTKSSGTWAAGAVVSHGGNGPQNNAPPANEAAFTGGVLYETWAPDTEFGRGLPVLGRVTGGAWRPDWSAVAA